MTVSTVSLKNQIILITGAAQDIGAAVAKCCARHGATVILLDKHIPTLEQVYDDILAAQAPQPAIYPLDMKGAAVSDYDALVATIEQTFGTLHGLIHCAATLGQLAPVPHQDPRTWIETLHINLTAPFLLTRACLPLMQKNKRASLVFTTDSHKHTAYWSAFGISKAGIEALGQQLADELEAEGRIRVNMIDPGPVKTEFYARAFPAKDLSAWARPEDIASTYVSLMDLNSALPHGTIRYAQANRDNVDGE